ncbi:biosynthetic-type acetolactate synthase large subunit [candidate division KSB1 bacterium]|nr:biosynthetic-type acetolactate synthase large subunit [candidate division KSB1 bacterium]RQW04283.1 MAG: biosynthetic-type acetolactate synthase large subunit [candidate division KSB1 bacterium]
MKNKMTGAEMILHALKKENVGAVFGYPGGAVLDIFDKLYGTDIQFYLTRHEQGAVHAADGYARASGQVGVCLATSGPGATNLVTGLATAHMDSVPIVAITGQVHTHLIGNDAFQEADVVGITRPVTKHNYLVKSVHELPIILKSAFYIARSGRPGPVVVDVPKDIQQQICPESYPDKVEIRSYKPTVKGHPQQIKKAAQMIAAANRPVIYAGGGVVASGASAELRELADTADIPVTTTLMGLGVYPETEAKALKMLGMHGTAYANYAVQECDLLIAIGARFDDRVTGKLDKFASKAKIIHIDIDPTSIQKNVKVDLPVVGDVKLVLAEINKVIEKKQNTDWIQTILTWKKEHPLQYNGGSSISPQYVIEQVEKVANRETIITTEVGQNQMWAAQFYKYTKPRTFLSSGGLGTMGYGFPAAIGAQVAHPDKLVVDIAGDGSIQMNIQELATAVLYHIPVKIIILNNQSLGMVRQWQGIFYDRRFSSSCLRRNINCPPHCDGSGDMCPKEYVPNFVKLAEAYGAAGYFADKTEEVTPTLEKAFNTPGPVIVEFKISEEENVYPMVPAGAPIDKMIKGMA